MALQKAFSALPSTFFSPRTTNFFQVFSGIVASRASSSSLNCYIVIFNTFAISHFICILQIMMHENRGKPVTAHAARKKTIKKIEILFIALLISTSFCTFAVSQVKAQTATIWTDKSDYQPGEIVTIYGTGFKPNAYVTINASKQSMDSYTTWNLTSDINGDFTTTYQIDNIGAALYVLTATDGINSATTTFTDSYTLNSISVGPQTP